MFRYVPFMFLLLLLLLDGSDTPVGSIIGGILGGVAAIVVVAIVVYKVKTTTGSKAITPILLSHEMQSNTRYHEREGSLISTSGLMFEIDEYTM